MIPWKVKAISEGISEILTGSAHFLCWCWTPHPEWHRSEQRDPAKSRCFAFYMIFPFQTANTSYDRELCVVSFLADLWIWSNNFTLRHKTVMAAYRLYKKSTHTKLTVNFYLFWNNLFVWFINFVEKNVLPYEFSLMYRKCL